MVPYVDGFMVTNFKRLFLIGFGWLHISTILNNSFSIRDKRKANPSCFLLELDYSGGSPILNNSFKH
jgi:hypothetical protein